MGLQAGAAKIEGQGKRSHDQTISSKNFAMLYFALGNFFLFSITDYSRITSFIFKMFKGDIIIFMSKS